MQARLCERIRRMQARFNSMSHSISRSFVNAKAKRRQYKRTASEADKVHGWYGNGISAWRRAFPARGKMQAWPKFLPQYKLSGLAHM